MSTLRSLRYKIAFVFFLVTAAAFTVIWFGVVPQLEQNLKEQRLANLRDEIRSTRPALELPTVPRVRHDPHFVQVRDGPAGAPAIDPLRPSIGLAGDG